MRPSHFWLIFGLNICMGKREMAYMAEAVSLSAQGMERGEGGPFGALVVLGDRIIGRGCNRVLSRHDPTAHAEVEAIREACLHLGHHQLDGCEMYCSCEPCPMCLGAIYWARPERVYYANTRLDARAAGFDDDFIYRELALPPQARAMPLLHMPVAGAGAPLQAWQARADKTPY